MNYKVLRARGVAFRDETRPAKDDQYLIGIVWHTIIDADDISSACDFLWVETSGVSSPDLSYISSHSES